MYLASAVVRRSGRKAFALVSVVSLAAAVLLGTNAQPALAAPVVTADGSITCDQITGAVTFKPALRAGGTTPSVATTRLALSGCTQAGNTNVGADVITAQVLGTQTLAHNDCVGATTELADGDGELAGGGSGGAAHTEHGNGEGNDHGARFRRCRGIHVELRVGNGLVRRSVHRPRSTAA